MNEEIVKLITEYVKNYQEFKRTETGWREPVIGFADARDELFPKLKEIIGPEHALPADIVSDARSVITFFLPFSEAVVKSNISGTESSIEWDIAKIETNSLIADLNQFLYEQIKARGFTASQLPATYNFDSEKLTSAWSHKSAAYISGIGKFGLNHLLITQSGCCGRLGSVITDMKLTPTTRTHEEYCLYKYNGSCKKCVERCISKALTVSGEKVLYDGKICDKILHNKNTPVYPIGIGDTCGKCSVDVPCSMGIPEKYVSDFNHQLLSKG